MELPAFETGNFATPERNSCDEMTLSQLSELNFAGLALRVRALEAERCNLQRLVCDLLRKNEILRAQIFRQPD